jgi:hypothetical protein
MTKILASILLTIGLVGTPMSPSAPTKTIEDRDVAITTSKIAYNQYFDMLNHSSKLFTPQERVNLNILDDAEDMAIRENGVSEDELWQMEKIDRMTRFMWRE